MNNFTLSQKQQLEDMTAAGTEVFYVEYDPTVESAPVVDSSFTEFYRETSTNLVEIIYTNPGPQ